MANDTIDLTGEESERDPESSVGYKRHRGEISGPSEEIAQSPAAEDAAKRRIMAFAKRQYAQGGTNSAAPPPSHLPVLANNSMLAQLHAERVARLGPEASARPAPNAAAFIQQLSLLSYNVWFAEQVALEQRMSAVGACIATHAYPDVICLQEVTPKIFHLFRLSSWFERYTCSPVPRNRRYFTLLLLKKSTVACSGAFEERPFPNSGGKWMGRSLLSVVAWVGPHRIRVATSHLESPCGWETPNKEPRILQCKMEALPLEAVLQVLLRGESEAAWCITQALKMLDNSSEGNILFAGDLNWQKADGALPLPTEDWRDMWHEAHPTDPGFTYDGKLNPMLGPHNRHSHRLDRILGKLQDWRLSSIQLVGTSALPGLTYVKEVTKGGKKGAVSLPVLPSDHFGLLLTLECNACNELQTCSVSKPAFVQRQRPAEPLSMLG